MIWVTLSLPFYSQFLAHMFSLYFPALFRMNLINIIVKFLINWNIDFSKCHCSYSTVVASRGHSFQASPRLCKQLHGCGCLPLFGRRHWAIVQTNLKKYSNPSLMTKIKNSRGMHALWVSSLYKHLPFSPWETGLTQSYRVLSKLSLKAYRLAP